MVRHSLALALMLALLASCGAVPTLAVQPSEQLLPPTTKGYLSVPDVDVLREQWNKTQLGQMVRDPLMEPFVEDVKRQIRTKLSKTDARLGISWDDLEGVYGGEVCVAVTQPWDAAVAQRAVAAAVEKDIAAAREAGKSDEQIAEIRTAATRSAHKEQERRRRAQRGLVLLVDVTGHTEEAQQLLVKVADELRGRGGTESQVTIADIEVVSYSIPGEDGAKPRHVFYCIHEDQLVATDSRPVAEAVFSRIQGQATDTLAKSPAFVAAMQNGRKTFGDIQPHIRWFVEPFGYVEVARAYEGGRRRRGTDLLRVLANQGFDAVRGMGGLIALSTGDHEILHGSLIYAPAVERAEGSAAKEKYRLAANMLDFPNKLSLQPESWIPGSLSSYLTFNWRLQSAFEYVSTLVDEIAGDEVFEDVLKSIETDPNGPQIDIRNDLVRHLSERVTLVSDFRLPVTPKSERLLLAAEVTDQQAVMKTVNKAMESDPAARKREHGEHIIWEILNEDPIEVEAVQIGGAGFGGFGFEEPEPVEENEKPLIPNSAVTVAYGHLLIASHVDYIVEILDQPAAGQRLEMQHDFVAVRQVLDNLGAGTDSFQFFTRTDDAYRPTYELVRMGKMPEAETMLGKLLNRLWEPDEEGVLREQYIDGSKMPTYDHVQKYFGPGGFFVQTLEGGWAITGCLLTKP